MYSRVPEAKVAAKQHFENYAIHVNLTKFCKTNCFFAAPLVLPQVQQESSIVAFKKGGEGRWWWDLGWGGGRENGWTMDNGLDMRIWLWRAHGEYCNALVAVIW